jgi:hypothetical protein
MMVGPNFMVNMSLNLHLSLNSKFGFKIIKNTRKTKNKIKKKMKWKIENSTWAKSSTTWPTYLIRPHSPTPSLRRRQAGLPRQAHSRTDRTLARAAGAWAPPLACGPDTGLSQTAPHSLTARRTPHSWVIPYLSVEATTSWSPVEAIAAGPGSSWPGISGLDSILRLHKPAVGSLLPWPYGGTSVRHGGERNDVAALPSYWQNESRGREKPHGAPSLGVNLGPWGMFSSTEPCVWMAGNFTLLRSFAVVPWHAVVKSLGSHYWWVYPSRVLAMFLTTFICSSPCGWVTSALGYPSLRRRRRGTCSAATHQSTARRR